MQEAYGVEAMDWLRMRLNSEGGVEWLGFGAEDGKSEDASLGFQVYLYLLFCGHRSFERGLAATAATRPRAVYSGHSAGLNTDIKAPLTALAVLY